MFLSPFIMESQRSQLAQALVELRGKFQQADLKTIFLTAGLTEDSTCELANLSYMWYTVKNNYVTLSAIVLTGNSRESEDWVI